jgi:hypothetical protein
MPSLIDRLSIISGGQSGVDTVGLVTAQEFEVPTGGTAPHGWWRFDDSGRLVSDPSFFRRFNLVEGPPDPKRWVLRTHANARDSDFTVWFGTESPGYFCTRTGCRDAGRPFLVAPSAAQIRTAFDTALREYHYVEERVIVNVAGNRHHTNPGASSLAQSVLREFMAGLQSVSWDAD